MKKLLMLACCLVMMGVGIAQASDYYYVTDEGADHDDSDAMVIIGKPVSGVDFDGGTCDSAGDWASGFWQGFSYVVVDGSSDKSSRLGEAWFATSGIAKGDRIDNVNEIAGTCTETVNSATATFKKFSGDDL